jgi:hypothetical protein
MGPHDTDENIKWLWKYRNEHPEVIITYPTDTPSGYWEVSQPGNGTMAFDSITGMRRALGGGQSQEEVPR